jgi:hypothetical protein
MYETIYTKRAAGGEPTMGCGEQYDERDICFVTATNYFVTATKRGFSGGYVGRRKEAGLVFEISSRKR